MHPKHAGSVRPLDSASGTGEATRASEASRSTTIEEAKNGQEESQEEIRKPQIARRPYAPTAAEVEAHLPLHLEFRPCCPHCNTEKKALQRNIEIIKRNQRVGGYDILRLLLHDR